MNTLIRKTIDIPLYCVAIVFYYIAKGAGYVFMKSLIIGQQLKVMRVINHMKYSDDSEE